MPKLIEFEDIEKARKTLGLKQVSSIKDIKAAYRQLSLKYHPDKAGDNSEEKFKLINHSYQLLMDYCLKYPISFSRERVKDVEEGEYQKYHQDRFYSTWF
ncbi:MAG: J domain-containing protein [Actinomycetia bacterium]|nr:J domain-containing protein [Actinomycetes bacterium]